MVIYLVLLVSFLWLCSFLWKKSPLHALPGPKQSWILGNIAQVDPNKVHISLFNWAKQYGKVWKMRFFKDEFVVVSGAEEIHEFMVNKSTAFAGRWHSYMIQVFSEQYQDIFSTDLSSDFKKRRKILHSHVKQYGSGMDDIERITDELASELVQELLEIKEGETVDMYYRFYGIANDIICIILHGERLEDKEERDTVGKLIPEILDTFEFSVTGLLLNLLPWTRHFGNKTYKRMITLLNAKRKLVKTWTERHQQKLGANEGLIQKLLALSNEERQNNNITDKVIQEIIWDFIFAGSLTTSETLSCLVNCLVCHPQVQSKLQRELKEVIGSRTVTIKDRQDLPYHLATLHEINRFLSVVTLFPRKAMMDSTLSGYKLAKGTLVVPDYFTLHHDEDFWGDPFAFRPERFLDDEGQVVPADHPNRKHLMPFGAGARVCVGEILAQTRMFLILAKMMQNLTFLPETKLEEQPSCDPRQLKFEAGLTRAPKYKVRVAPLDKK